MKMQFESMLCPLSTVRSGVRWTGQYILLIPLKSDGSLSPYGEMFGGYRNVKGRKVYVDDQPVAHQGAKECRRRAMRFPSCQQ